MKSTRTFKTDTLDVQATRYLLKPGMNICQSDYPLDWYQKEFIPYAEEYQALPDRKPETVLPWMRRYMDPALKALGGDLLLLAHFYMGGEIVKLIELFGGKIADSYQLALMAYRHPEKKLIVESAVHFMAETIAILASDEQRVFITNPKSGCTMEMNAKDYMVEPAFAALNERYGEQNILPVAYMNTSGRIKALAGQQGGAVCTSSNVEKIFRWALTQNKKILFIPDRHMGENVASWVGVKPENIALWPGGTEGAHFSLSQSAEHFDRAHVILFGSECGVHTYYTAEMVDAWHAKNFHVTVHPECRKVVVDRADSCGSTAFLWDHVLNDRAGTKHYAVGTENHFVVNLKTACADKGIKVVNLGEAMVAGVSGMGCGCATMARNDPPHLVGLLDLLRQGNVPAINEVRPGDVVDEFTGRRQRFDVSGQRWLKDNARRALEKMIEISES